MQLRCLHEGTLPRYMFRGRIRLEGAYHGLHATWLTIGVPFYIIADTKHHIRLDSFII